VQQEAAVVISGQGQKIAADFTGELPIIVVPVTRVNAGP
jgi:hypothetical protein